MISTAALMLAVCALIGLAMVSAAVLRGWQGWLALKNRELELRRAEAPGIGHGAREGAARIELADLRERIRRLEAIANGVDL